MEKFKIVHLIGSTKEENEKAFVCAERYYTNLGYIVFKPVFFGVPDNYPKKQMLIDMCTQKLEMCDVVAVVGRVGKSTAARIEQAEKLGKEVWYY